VEGIAPETIEDLAIWIFLGGLLGARLTSLFTTGQYPWSMPLRDWFYRLIAIWDGGIVLYGAIVGGTISFFVAYFLFYRKSEIGEEKRPADMTHFEWHLLLHRKKGLNVLRFIDVVTPSVALGLVLGRLGCFFNGCCYGQVACAACVAV